MWITNVSPALLAGAPSAAMSIPELSIETWPSGLRRISKIAAGVVGMIRSTSSRSLDMTGLLVRL